MPLKKPRLALVLQSEALAVDVDDSRVVEDAIEHRDGEHTVGSEGGISDCRT
jgi:hypothetical protein